MRPGYSDNAQSAVLGFPSAHDDVAQRLDPPGGQFFDFTFLDGIEEEKLVCDGQLAAKHFAYEFLNLGVGREGMESITQCLCLRVGPLLLFELRAQVAKYARSPVRVMGHHPQGGTGQGGIGGVKVRGDLFHIQRAVIDLVKRDEGGTTNLGWTLLQLLGKRFGIVQLYKRANDGVVMVGIGTVSSSSGEGGGGAFIANKSNGGGNLARDSRFFCSQPIQHFSKRRGILGEANGTSGGDAHIR